ncbi:MULTISPECIES: DUF1853 family protein [Leeuwenhoekiella]|uniref:DUF1853 family protein n=1 Tax=Leeuwenhoekiella TaxID=283735 RepID=UPI0021CEADC9|nr:MULTISPECIES: DUF1853 family protein [Leeuwenhoekiella]
MLPNAFTISNTLRFGHRMEYFMEAALRANDFRILAKNLQIIAKKKTLGELDFILETPDNFHIHVEMVYKFYLYDPDRKGSWIEKLVGPNLKDHLSFKLQKLKEHQFPMLQQEETLKLLEQLNIRTNAITQQLFFKAQLFVPVSTRIIDLDKELIAGNFYKQHELALLNQTTYRFYIPEKQDWVCEPYNDAYTLNFDSFYATAQQLLEQQRSFMFWCFTSKKIEKHFACWW